MQYLDVGGGLGVDYDGSQTNFESSVNYTLQEYANDVVFHIQSVCDDAGVPHPTIFSESGRAIVSYHSMLVFNVLGVSGRSENGDTVPAAAARRRRAAAAGPVGKPTSDLTVRNVLESYHDAQQALDMTHAPVRRRLHAAGTARPGREPLLGHLPQNPRLTRQMEYVPEELEVLDVLLERDLFLQFLALPVDAR